MRRGPGAPSGHLPKNPPRRALSTPTRLRPPDPRGERRPGPDARPNQMLTCRPSFFLSAQVYRDIRQQLEQAGDTADETVLPVHLFPEGGMTNGAGVMEFNRGCALVRAPVVPVALRCRHALGISSHTLTSSFLENMFWLSFAPWTALEADVLPPVVKARAALLSLPPARSPACGREYRCAGGSGSRATPASASPQEETESDTEFADRCRGLIAASLGVPAGAATGRPASAHQ